MDFFLGDGRVELQKINKSYDLWVIDAFLGGTIPFHLVTREALTLYRERLQEGGVIAIHISHRVVDFRQIIANTASGLGLKAFFFQNESAEPSSWLALMAKNVVASDWLELSLWTEIKYDTSVVSWSDNQANLFVVW